MHPAAVLEPESVPCKGCGKDTGSEPLLVVEGGNPEPARFHGVDCWNAYKASRPKHTTPKEPTMLCAVPLHTLDPLTGFLMELGEGPVVGVVGRVPEAKGYVQVTYCNLKGGKHHRFRDRDGEVVDFTDSGFRRTEWSAGTLVRPLMGDDEMSEQTDNPALVEAPGGNAPSKAEIREKVAKLKAQAAAKVAKPAGKVVGKVAPTEGKSAAAAKASREPKVREQNPCVCACGETTGGRFAPGHDARYYGWLKKIAAGTKEFKELPKAVQKVLVDVRGVRKELAGHGKG